MTLQDLQDELRAHIRARIGRGELTGSALARDAAIPQGHLSNFLNLRRGLSLESMDRLLAALQISVADLVGGNEVMRSAHPRRDRSSLEPVAVVAEENAALARFTADQILSTRGFQKKFLRRLKARAAVDRRDWLRFVLVKVDSHSAGSLFPAAVTITLLIDRHYSSLEPYRRFHPNLYAVRFAGACVVAHITLCDNCLVLRRRAPQQDSEIIPIERGRTYSDYIVGRVCHVGIEV